MTRTWKDVWAARQLDESKTSTLERLMAADGLDTGFGSVTEPAWIDFVESVAGTLDVAPGMRVFEVGCGAGALLYPLAQNGCIVGGIDQSTALVGYARQAIPQGSFILGDASALDPVEPWDAVLACGVFLYFPDLDYARGVLTRMVAKATHAIAILDVPDLDRKEQAIDFRQGSMGKAEYEARYKGLDHLYYDRAWMFSVLAEVGVSAVQIEEQRIEGYANAPYRFNVFGRIAPSSSAAPAPRRSGQ